MPSDRVLVAEPLTPENFAPFGDVIAVAAAKQQVPINHGYSTRFGDLATVDVTEESGRVRVNILRSTPMKAPITVRLMERHPLSSQAFIPLHRRPYLVVVAPPGPFDAGALRAFLARGDQGVNYARGVWHHFLLALEAESDFLAIDRAGPGENFDEVELPQDEQVEIRIDSGARTESP